jgi:probable HAF family extracellular repeat protein
MSIIPNREARHCLLAPLALFAVLALIAAKALAESPYQPNLLETAGISFSEAHSVNNKGIIAGTSDFNAMPHTATVWRHNKPQPIDILGGGLNSAAFGINDAGDVVGYLIDGNFAARPFLWSDGKLVQLPSLGNGGDYVANINNSGDAVGYSTDANGVTRAALWRNGVITNLTPSPDTWVAGAFGINDSDQMSGNWNNRAVAWIDNTRIDLGTPLDRASNATSINNSNQVVGYIVDVSNPSPYTAFIWANGQLNSLGTLGGVFVGCIAYDINDRGEAVGECHNEDRSMWRGFIWKNGNLTELPPLPDDNSSSAHSINNKGFVVGFSYGGEDASPPRAVSWK